MYLVCGRRGGSILSTCKCMCCITQIIIDSYKNNLSLTQLHPYLVGNSDYKGGFRTIPGGRLSSMSTTYWKQHIPISTDALTLDRSTLPYYKWEQEKQYHMQNMVWRPQRDIFNHFSIKLFPCKPILRASI